MCPRLTSLLCPMNIMNDKQMAHLSRSLPLLSHLACQFRSPVPKDDSVSTQYFPCLHTLEISIYDWQSGTIPISLCHLSLLQTLHLELNIVSDIASVFLALAYCKQLQHLHVAIIDLNKDAQDIRLDVFQFAYLQTFRLTGRFNSIVNPGRLQTLQTYIILQRAHS